MERTARVAAPLGLALFAALGVLASERELPLSIGAASAAVVLAVAAAGLRLTGGRLVAVLAPAAALLVVIGHGTGACLSWMGICVLTAWITLTSAVGVAIVGGVALTLIPITEWVLQPDEPGWIAWTVGTMFTTVCCLFAARLRVTVEQLRTAQEHLAEQTRAAERSRIAAEVHDVVGHALTVALLQIGSARLALDEEPEVARQALEAAEELARRSLDEVRGSVGLIRSDAPSMTPLPSAADITELVASFQRAGTEVDLVTGGDLVALGQTRGLAAYRIVQEALTNAVRHAIGEPVSVRIVVGEDQASLTVTNAGTAVATAPGSGLRGMRERAESVGGRLSAGPVAGGWLVEAVLPR